MAGLVIGFGVALVLLGAGAYFGSGMASATALIPAFFGAAVIVCGAGAARPGWTRGAVLGAAVIAVVGVVGALSRIVPKLVRGEAIQIDIASGSQIAMAVLCAVLAVVCSVWLIRSRRAARPGA